MAEETCPTKDVVHVEHEEGVIDWGGELDVAKVPRALEVAQATCRAARVGVLAVNSMPLCTGSHVLGNTRTEAGIV